MRFNCPYCNQHFDADDEMAGMDAECPTCKAEFILPSLPPTPQKRPRRTALIAGSVALALVLVTTGVLLLWPHGRTGGAHEATEPAEKPDPGRPAKLESLKVISARLAEDSESMQYPMTGSYRVYILRLVLENTGKSPMCLGDSAVLFETTSDGNSYDGVLQTRLALFPKKGPTPFDTKRRYVMNNVQHVNRDGEGKPLDVRRRRRHRRENRPGTEHHPLQNHRSRRQLSLQSHLAADIWCKKGDVEMEEMWG